MLLCILNHQKKKWKRRKIKLEGIDSIMALPDISFINNMSLEDCQQFLITRYQENYKEITGKAINLQKASPRRIELLSVAELMYYTLQCVDKAGKMNFLKYAYGGFLEHLGAFKNVQRTGAKKAYVPVEFSLAQIRETAVGIDKGVTVTADQKIFFETQEYSEIPPGQLSVTLVLVCTTSGTAGNGYAPGEINTLCNPVGFVTDIKNTATSRGGEDELSDDGLKEKIYMSPSGYSAAGPDDAWITFTKNYSAEVSDVEIWSGEDSVVNICVMLKNGKIPDSSFLDGLSGYLSESNRKPTADRIKVQPPEIINYTIEATYYIAKSNKSAATAIQEEVNGAVCDYICWQGAHDSAITARDSTATAHVGRDLNPDELVLRVKNAGAKRIVITSPVYCVIEKNQIAGLALKPDGTPDIKLVYGGIEDD